MRYLIIIPLIIFLAMAIFFWQSLGRDPHQLPSPLIGKPVVEFSLPSLMHTNQPFTQQQFLGHVSLLNVWGSWCITCHTEHSVLMEIAHQKKVTLYGLNYKDERAAAQAWLDKYGNPYKDIIFDDKGRLAIDLGVYGTPETFVIDANGIIRYKHIGPISSSVWDEKIAPVIDFLLSPFAEA